jgi:hypothetical protein
MINLRFFFSYIFRCLQKYIFVVLLNIIRLPKITVAQKGKTGIVTVCCHQQVPFLLFTFYLFFSRIKKRIPFFVIDDGSLTDRDANRIQKKFFGVKIISSSEAKQKMYSALADYPACYKFRFLSPTSIFKLKLFDIFQLTTLDKFLYIDPDVLFLHQSIGLMNWLLSKNTKPLYARNPQYPDLGKPETTHEWSIILRMLNKRFKQNIDINFSSGLMGIQKSIYSLKTIERRLTYYYEVGLDINWTPEQFILSTLFADAGSFVINESYARLYEPIKNYHLKYPYMKASDYLIDKTNRFYYKTIIQLLISCCADKLIGKEKE